jgi:hypothetical protein
VATTTARTSTNRTSAHTQSLGLSPEDIVRRLAAVFGRNLLALIVGKSVRTVDRWVANDNLQLDPADERTVRDTFQVYSLLKSVEGDHTIRAWFMGMNPQLEEAAPAEALADGRSREVMAAAKAFVTGG